jgi:predicted nucleic acid-binding protein
VAETAHRSANPPVRSAIDTNVISALLANQPATGLAERLLLASGAQGGLVICGPVYAELIAHPGITPAFIDNFLLQTGIDVEFDLGKKIWDSAGLAHQLYARRRIRSGGGKPRRILADFLIGAHASIRADRLVTFDPDGYNSDFPQLVLLGG